MFYRNEDGRLFFRRLDFSIFADDIIYDAKPKSMDDLRWMVRNMVDMIQLSALEYVQATDGFDEDEWEDVFFPNY